MTWVHRGKVSSFFCTKLKKLSRSKSPNCCNYGTASDGKVGPKFKGLAPTAFVATQMLAKVNIPSLQVPT
jgi:hypothetical protein